MSRLRDLIEYVQRFEPDYSASLAPAASDELDRLVELAGPLPAAYREFLETMGASMGPLKVQEGDLTANAAIEFYEEGDDLPEPRYLYIGENDEDPYPGYFLDRQVGPADDPAVASFEPGSELDPAEVLAFESLADMLFWSAARQFGMASMGVRGFLTALGEIDWSSRRPFDDVARIADGEGFRRVAGTGNWMHIYEREDALMIAQTTGDAPGVLVELAAVGESTFGKLAALLRDHVGVA